MGRLWLPKAARPKPRRLYKCNVPGCERDGKPFSEEEREQYQRHVLSCHKKNADTIEQLTAEKEANPFTSILDKEQHKFVRERKAGVRSKRIVVPRSI